jgi:hypothetical protein
MPSITDKLVVGIEYERIDFSSCWHAIPDDVKVLEKRI